LVLFPLMPALGLALPHAVPHALPWLIPLALYTSYCSGVITHNHVHVPVFRSHRANAVYGMWLSIFYGSPIALWIPTHLEHHHRHVDGPEDATRTRRRSVKHNVWQAIAYTVSCASWQWPLISDYVRRARSRRGREWTALRNQIMTLGIGHAAVLALAVHQHGARMGLLCYGFAFGLPALLAPSFMQFTNYIQHVHCDATSADNHSRNFVNAFINWFVFDGGYHTVHHERPSVHWSRYAELHRERVARIEPSLQSHSILAFCVQNYLLGAIAPSLRTRPIAGARHAARELSVQAGLHAAG
jgi:fatty acid desaturase